MKTVKYLSIVMAGLFLFMACQKEFSLESGYAGKIATGSLLDTSGNCQNIVVSGSYITDSTLTTNNYVTVQVNFKTGGNYKIFTDAQNGFSFQDSGFAAPGLQSIKLRSTGRPILAKPTIFSVAFDTTFCNFTVNVIGSTPATYTLVGTSGSCSNATIGGTYSTGTALNSANIVTLEVAVTAVGSYSVTTGPVGGMTFSGTGNLTTLGLQIITLQGTGTPITVGANVFPVTAGSSSCSFTIPVTAGAADPNVSDSAWSFTQGTNSFHGPFITFYDTTVSSTYAVGLIGYTAATGDTTIFFGTFFPGKSIQTGVHSSTDSAFFNFQNNGSGTPAKIYYADPTTRLTADTKITISSYDATTKIITGTFTGTALNASGTPVPVTNGKFRARLR